jgi:hypothetical protein
MQKTRYLVERTSLMWLLHYSFVFADDWTHGRAQTKTNENHQPEAKAQLLLSKARVHERRDTFAQNVFGRV